MRRKIFCCCKTPFASRSIWLLFIWFALLTLCACGGSSSNKNDQEGENSELLTELAELVESAYTFGFPAVEHYKLAHLYFVPGTGLQANQFFHRRELATPSDTLVVGPNNDTMSSATMLDVRAEPVVVSVPNIDGRYFSIQLLNIFTENLSIIASEQEGAIASNVIVAGPGWDESNFENAHNFQIIRSESQLILALARVEVRGEDDVEAATVIQDQLLITPLSDFVGNVSPPPAAELTWPINFNAKRDNSASFFSYMNFMLQFHEFSEEEQALISDFSVLSIGPGWAFDLNDFSALEQAAIAQGISAARNKTQFPESGVLRNGWTVPNDLIGEKGSDYPFRAVVAWHGLYALNLSEAAYISARTDIDGGALDASAYSYVFTLAEDQLPPAKYFWSLTIYNSDGGLVHNSIARYSVGDRSEFLRYNEDGSLTLYLQSTPPNSEGVTNWLPTPNGPFSITMRMYGPRDIVKEGRYIVPGIESMELL